MTIVDKEVIGEGSYDDYVISKVSLGIFDDKGDSGWLLKNCQLAN